VITYVNARYNGSPEPNVTQHKKSTHAAYTSLVRFEIGYGGVIVDLSPTKVVCKTPVLGSVDVVTFTGSEKDMRPLVLAAGYSLQLRAAHKDELIDGTMRSLSSLTGGKPKTFEVAHFGPLLMGQSIAKAACLLGIEVEPTEGLLNRSFDDLMAAAELHLETGEPFLSIL